MIPGLGGAVGGLGGLAGGLGGLAGSLMTNSALGKAQRQGNAMFGEGRDYLDTTNKTQREDFMPFMQAGQQAIGQYQNLLGAGSGAVNPTQTGAFNFDAFKDPSAQYRMDQSNAAINASALAKGNVGGGLGKALMANSQNMASEEFNNAFNRFLSKGNQDFGQQQQLWNNANQNWQTQLGGFQNLMGQGLNAAGTTGGFATNLANAYNTNLMNNAGFNYNAAGDRAGALAGGLDSAVSGITGLFG